MEQVGFEGGGSPLVVASTGIYRYQPGWWAELGGLSGGSWPAGAAVSPDRLLVLGTAGGEVDVRQYPEGALR